MLPIEGKNPQNQTKTPQNLKKLNPIKRTTPNDFTEIKMVIIRYSTNGIVMLRITEYLKNLHKQSTDDLTYNELICFFKANRDNNVYALLSFYTADQLKDRLTNECITQSEFDNAVDVMRDCASKEMEICAILIEGNDCGYDETEITDDHWEYYQGENSIF